MVSEGAADHWRIEAHGRVVRRVLSKLREIVSVREDMLRLRVMLGNSAKAQSRRLKRDAADGRPVNAADAHAGTQATLTAARVLEATEKVKSAAIVDAVLELPIAPWVKHPDNRGLGEVGVGSILARTGDLWNYANPAKVWMRMGVGVVDGRAQRRVAGADALRQKFSPYNATIIHRIAVSLLQGNRGGRWKKLYDERKAKYRAMKPERDPHVPPGRKYSRKFHVHNRALRIVKKQLLKELWREWRRCLPGGAGDQDEHVNQGKLVSRLRPDFPAGAPAP